MKIYLINPQIPLSFCGQEYASRILFKKYPTPPLGLLTVAAMIGPEHEIDFCDENISSINWRSDCDIVVLTGMHIQKKRLREIAVRFRHLGKKIIVGGPSAMAMPQWYRDVADILILGEAERIWPQCLGDLAAGNAKDIYQEKDSLSLEDSPIPRFDLVSPRDYINMSLQTTRGCPFSCEFCDIITLYGRKVRTKPLKHILTELELLSKMGAERIFFVDDNFIGNPNFCAALLEAIVRLNEQLKRTAPFSCQATINVAKNAALLKLLYRAGCRSMFIGVETPRISSLEETHKFQNARTDMLQDIETIQSCGIAVYSGMVVGFDHDDSSIFEEQLRFINQAKIPVCLPSQLVALPGTPLHTRLKIEGRLTDGEFQNSFESNMIPKQMSRTGLNWGYLRLIENLYQPAAFTDRILGELKHLDRAANDDFSRSSNAFFIRLSFLWTFAWFLFDSNRTKLLEAFWRLFPKVLIRHPHTADQALIRLVLYRHILHFVDFCRKELEGEFEESNGLTPLLSKGLARTA